MPDAEIPEIGWTLLQTRMINQWLGSSYTLEQVAEMDPLIPIILQSVDQGMNPTPGKREEAPRGR